MTNTLAYYGTELVTAVKKFYNRTKSKSETQLYVRYGAKLFLLLVGVLSKFWVPRLSVKNHLTD
jgi:hypothetical protein